MAQNEDYKSEQQDREYFVYLKIDTTNCKGTTASKETLHSASRNLIVEMMKLALEITNLVLELMKN